jgi:hypothetical protein
MDKNQLQEFLEEHGELRARGVMAKYRNKDIEHRDDTLKWEPNPIEKICSDCGKIAIDRVVQYKLIYIGQPNQRYQKKCSECKQYLGRSKTLE